MDQTTQQNAAMVEQSTAASAALASEAARLRDLVAQFRLPGGQTMAAHKADPRATSYNQAAPSQRFAAPVSRGNTALKAQEWSEF
jgi:methyl-accepting chemotaxis protein